MHSPKIVLLILLGCAAFWRVDFQNTAKADSAEPVELDYYIWDQELVYTERVVNAFNTIQPDIHVTVHVLKNETYDDEIKKRSGAKRMWISWESVGLQKLRTISRKDC